MIKNKGINYSFVIPLLNSITTESLGLI